jgi:hypothetical protein
MKPVRLQALKLKRAVMAKKRDWGFDFENGFNMKPLYALW